MLFPVFPGNRGAQSAMAFVGVGVWNHGVMNKQMAVHRCHHPWLHNPLESEGCVFVSLD